MKKRKRKKSKIWEIPKVAKSEKELRNQINQMISFSSVVKSCNLQRKYDTAFEFAQRVNELSHVIIDAMIDLPPEKQ